jgi:hypothetical protein
VLHPCREQVHVGPAREVERDPTTVTRGEQPTAAARGHGAGRRDVEDLGALAQQRRAVDAEVVAQSGGDPIESLDGRRQWKTSPPFTSSA